MKASKKIIICILSIAIITSISTPLVFGASTAPSISSSTWIKNALTSIASKQGVVQGEIYKYDITRADFTVLLVRGLNLKADSNKNFKDVYVGAYYSRDIGVARTLKIIEGVGNNKFRPEGKITKQDMAIIIYNAFKETKKDLAISKRDLSKYSDYKTIAKYAVEPMTQMISHNIVDVSNNKIEPKGYVTREEAIKVLSKAVKLYKQIK